MFFDIAVVDENHKFVKKYKVNYDRNKDIASNIYMVYQNKLKEYKINYIGVGISNNIDYKEGFLHKVTSFDFNRYNLKQSLYKLFKMDISIFEETDLAALAIANQINESSLIYLLIDNKLSNSVIIDKKIVELDDDNKLKNNEKVNELCSKDYIKSEMLKSGFDDDYIGAYFFSKNVIHKNIIKKWSENLEKFLMNIIKNYPVNKIVFAGYLGEYLEYFKKYLKCNSASECVCISNHRDATLLGVSHLIFKDN